ncbi:MAG: 4a-hydroxytetrahydrobiopterin dehydratase [archaeon]|nr:MAG: 4a-hydroxytetrahydrobiopterin dehydratase [archaeon]
MPRILTTDEVQKGLSSLDGWRLEGDFIVRRFSFKKFMDGISFISQVSKVAERLDHHPDISVRYTNVTLSLQTHSEGGVTSRDLKLAAEIDKERPGGLLE